MNKEVPQGLINDFKDPNLNNIFQKLSDEDKSLLRLSLLGYNKRPPTIDEFLEDDYYLGGKGCLGKSLYDAWRRELRDVFPNEIDIKYTIISSGGAIGIGKSTFSTVVSLYSLCKMMCLKDPWETLHLAKIKDLCWSFCHRSSDLAYDTFIKPIEIQMDNSPFFQRNTLKKHHFELVPDSCRTNAIIGRDLVGSVLSELNFYPPDVAWSKLSTVISRNSSRMQLGQNLFSYIILDSSVKNDDDICEKFLKENPVGDNLKRSAFSIWEVKPEHYFKDPSKTFKFYLGDSTHRPQILPKNIDELPADINRDLIIDAPGELYTNAVVNPVLFCQDSAGKPTMSSDLFLPYPEDFLKSFKLPKMNPDVITMDFYEKDDKLIYKVQTAIDSIPKSSIIYMHCDLALKDDIAGLSICYFKEWILSEDRVKIPSFSVPLIIGMSRKEGQETALYQIFDFICDMKDEGFTWGKITFDQFASSGLRQDLLRAGFTTDYLSVDRNDKAYNTIKTLFSNGQIDVASNERFKNEMLQLKIVDRNKGKIDHPAVSSYLYDSDGNRVPDHSKDLADSVVGSVYSCFNDLDLSTELANQKATRQQINAINDMLNTPEEESRKVFTEMLNDIF